MYQLEVLSQQDLQQALCLPKEVQQAFILGQTVIDNCFRYSVLQWEEHCTECAMPACYKTCDLYEPRRDGHCRRFVKGIVPLSIAERQYPVVQVDFKRWGALMSTSYIGVFEPQQAILLIARHHVLNILLNMLNFQMDYLLLDDGVLLFEWRHGIKII
ncbi:hypothetical protein [Photobacterium kishitanii]|uniref:hypothetical protein n=1 Tax=Photobacterium kishitanii TaxID=318456 RepID=UPI00069CAFF6|nr:hypothetical protein [Photobacterium kishitanii]OBU32299.1 hypothetical protein AYY23_04150 [Photobacterium kishitanii]